MIQQGQPERVHLISRTQGYHGTHGFGTSIGGIEANTSNWGPLVPAVSAVATTRCPRWRRRSSASGPSSVAAFFCEPVIGAGGVYPPPEGYIEGVADLCAEHGILLVVDSVICGFGRLGTWYGIERWEDVRPDMITFAKGVTARLPAARRRGRLRRGRRRRSSRPRAARCSATARPTPATRRAARPRWR